MHAHHKIPKKIGGTDEYSNLIMLNKDVHILVHATNEEIIKRCLEMLSLNKTAFAKVNMLRELVGNCKLSTNK